MAFSSEEELSWQVPASNMPVQASMLSSLHAVSCCRRSGTSMQQCVRYHMCLATREEHPQTYHCLIHVCCPRSLALSLSQDMQRPRAALGRRRRNARPPLATRVPAAARLSLALVVLILFHCRSSAGVVLHTCNRSPLRYSSADSLPYQHYSHHKPTPRRDTNHTTRALTPRQLDPASSHARAEHRRCFACRAATSPDRPTRARSSTTSRITSGHLSVAESLALPTAGQPTLSACLRYWATSASLPCLRPRTLLLKRRLTLPRATP